MPGFAFGAASTTLVGQSLGAGKPNLADRYMKVCVLTAMVVMSIAGTMLFFFGKYIVLLFSNEAEVLELEARKLENTLQYGAPTKEDNTEGVQQEDSQADEGGTQDSQTE